MSVASLRLNLKGRRSCQVWQILILSSYSKEEVKIRDILLCNNDRAQ